MYIYIYIHIVLYVCMFVCLYICLYVVYNMCVYVYIYIYIYIYMTPSAGHVRPSRNVAARLLSVPELSRQGQKGGWRERAKDPPLCKSLGIWTRHWLLLTLTDRYNKSCSFKRLPIMSHLRIARLQKSSENVVARLVYPRCIQGWATVRKRGCYGWKPSSSSNS